MSKSNKKNAAAVVATVAAEVAPVAVPVVEVAPVAPVAPEAPVAASTRAFKAEGAFATIWAHLNDPANAGLSIAEHRAALKANPALNHTTINCQLSRWKQAKGDRVIASAFGRSKADGYAKLEALAANGIAPTVAVEPEVAPVA